MSKVVGVGVSHRLVSPFHPREHYRVRCWRCGPRQAALRLPCRLCRGRALGPTGFQLAVGISRLDLGRVSPGGPQASPLFPGHV